MSGGCFLPNYALYAKSSWVYNEYVNRDRHPSCIIDLLLDYLMVSCGRERTYKTVGVCLILIAWQGQLAKYIAINVLFVLLSIIIARKELPVNFDNFNSPYTCRPWLSQTSFHPSTREAVPGTQWWTWSRRWRSASRWR